MAPARVDGPWVSSRGWVVAVAGLIVALVALAIAGVAAWYARQQTLAQRRQADAARQAADDARRSADAAEELSTLERQREHEARRPQISAVQRSVAPGVRAVEFTNEGGVDLASVEVTIRAPREQAAVVLSGFLISDGGPTQFLAGSVTLPLRASETCAARVQIDVTGPGGGDVIFDCRCVGVDGGEWSVPVPCGIAEDAVVVSASGGTPRGFRRSR